MWLFALSSWVAKGLSSAPAGQLRHAEPHPPHPHTPGSVALPEREGAQERQDEPRLHDLDPLAPSPEREAEMLRKERESPPRARRDLLAPSP